LFAVPVRPRYAVQVVGDVQTVVVNHGKYTIADIDAGLKLRDGEIVKFQSRERKLGTSDLDAELLKGIPMNLVGTAPIDHSDILAPWDAGLRFIMDAITIAGNLAGAYPVVRWTDRWGNRREHQLGHVVKVEDRGRGRHAG
jgi:hypothetical protein